MLTRQYFTNDHVSLGRGTPSLRIWVITACVLLGASGGVRHWQDHRFREAAKRNTVDPIAIPAFARVTGDWKLVEGGETHLDPKVERAAGASVHCVRTYVNTLNGVTVTVLVLYGASKEVAGHTPAVCYPSAGFKSIEEPMLRPLLNGDGRGLGYFRSEVFSKGEGAAAELQEVYHAFRVNGRWVPEARIYWKQFRNNPGLLKIQTQRRLGPNERRFMSNPTEELLGLVVREIERSAPPM